MFRSRNGFSGGNITTFSNLAFAGCPNLSFVCSSTSYAYAYASENGIPVSTLVIAAIPNQTYIGSYIRPEVTVTLSNSSLTKNIDYTVSYSNNKNVGQATATVSGRGSYDMLVSKAKFTIVTRNISKATIFEIKPQRYTGEKIEPSLNVTDNGRYLKEGTDYKAYYYTTQTTEQFMFQFRIRVTILAQFRPRLKSMTPAAVRTSAIGSKCSSEISSHGLSASFLHSDLK